VNAHTPPISIAALVDVRVHPVGPPQLVQPEVGDLQDESRINDAIRGLEVTVALHFRCMEIRHAANDVVYQRYFKHAVQVYLLVLQYILSNSRK